MYILGISESHNSTAALLKDGQIIACAQEERFTRLKNQGGFPKKGVDWCLKYASITIDEIDLMVFSYEDLIGSLLYAKKQEGGYSATLLGSIKSFIFGRIYTVSGFFPLILSIYQLINKAFHRLVAPIVRWHYAQKLSHRLGIPISRIKFINHHLCHAFAANYIFDQTKFRHLVITNDGSGDEDCGKVFIVEKNKWQEIASTPNRYSLAFLYYYVTQFLGFTPDEEEYKVMGLAPYAKESAVLEILPIFRQLIWCEGLSFKSKIPQEGYYGYLKLKLQDKRFDEIAGALQVATEELVVTQVKNAIKKTGITEVVLGGGLALNIKANMQTIYQTSLERLSVCPSAGDESTAIGACLWGYQKMGFQPMILSNLYLGPDFSEKEIAITLKKEKILNSSHFKVTRLDRQKLPLFIAKLLSSGKIIARFSGRMEFGARALGNRSILADPRNPKIISIINSQIKQRDFWMPFAPTIVYERAKDYLINPKNIDSPFMAIGFKTTPKAYIEIPATLHPADSTCRPQILKREDNPEFYNLIEEFERLTGVGTLLNTSFNLHGEPIVCTPKDAIKTFKKSGLEYLLLEDYLIKKVSSKPR